MTIMIVWGLRDIARQRNSRIERNEALAETPPHDADQPVSDDSGVPVEPTRSDVPSSEPYWDVQNVETDGHDDSPESGGLWDASNVRDLVPEQNARDAEMVGEGRPGRGIPRGCCEEVDTRAGALGCIVRNQVRKDIE